MPDALIVLRANTPEAIVRFVDALLADPEMRAGVAGQAIGLNPQQAGVMLRDSRVIQLIAAMTQSLRETNASLRLQAVQMLAQIAAFDPADAFGENGMIKRMRDIPPLARAAIKSYREKADGSIQIEWIDRVRVIDMLMKCFGDVENDKILPTQSRVVFRNRGKDPKA